MEALSSISSPPDEGQQDCKNPNKKDAGRETHEDTGGEILGRRSARRPGNNPQNNTEQDQQYADTSFPAAPELLPYPCDGLLKRTISLHIANNLSCAYIKSNPFTSFLPHPYCLASTLIAGIALTVFISGRLTGPLRELRHAMVRAGGGDLNANVHVRRKDEIALLARTYNRMLADTKEYIRENERNQRRQKELELKTLQYQINPHFLYNTLDSIYMMARRSGNGEIEDMVTSLSTLFRLSLAHGQDFVTLEHEIRYITCYLQIQRIRFPLDFTWHTTIPDELRHCRVMKFLLQPLVENSLNHGLRNKPGGGQICVSARREGDELILVVADDGMGMTEEQLHALLELINRTDMEENRDPFAGGVGVRNVHQRLLLSYGHGLEIESDWEEGTTVTIRIPFQNDEESKEEFL